MLSLIDWKGEDLSTHLIRQGLLIGVVSREIQIFKHSNGSGLSLSAHILQFHKVGESLKTNIFGITDNN